MIVFALRRLLDCLRAIQRRRESWGASRGRPLGPIGIHVTPGPGPLPDMPAGVRQIIDDNRAALVSGALLQPLLVTARLGAAVSGTVSNRYGDVYLFRATRV